MIRTALFASALACAACASTSTKDVVTAPVRATARVGSAVGPAVAAGAVQSATLPARAAVGVAGAAAGALSSSSVDVDDRRDETPVDAGQPQ